jgi:hypothetical protein
MARVRVPITVLDLSGNAVTGAAVRIRDRSTLIDTTIYQAEVGAGTETNPVFTTSQGIAPGWVESGAYRADISGTGITSYEVPFDALARADEQAAETAMDARIDVLELPMGGFDAWRTTNSPGLAANAWQAVTMDAKTAESSAWFSTATGRYTPLVAGWYQLSVFLTQDAIATFGSGTFWIVGLGKNGAAYKQLGSMTHQAVIGPRAGASTLVYANGSTDYFQPMFYFNDSVVHGCLAGVQFTHFSGSRAG